MFSFDGWMFSARLAWGRPWLRWASVFALVLSLGTGTWFVSQVLPVARANGAFAFHYNIYVGIDDVRGWGWVFVLPAAWIVLTMLDILLAFGTYRADQILASSLVGLALLWSLPWAVALFYLTVVNSV